MTQAKGSITLTQRSAKPYRWRYKGTDKYFKTLKEAKEAQRAFLDSRIRVGAEVSDAFRAALERHAVEAYGILKDAGLTDPKVLVEAARIRAERGTNKHTLSSAIELISKSLTFNAISKGTADKYSQRWYRFLADIGDLELVAIEASHIRSHLESRQKTASATEANKTHTALSALFSKYLPSVGVELPNPMRDVFKPKQGEVNSKEPYTLNEVLALESQMLDNPSDFVLFQIQKLAGYRASEAVQLCFKDIGLGKIPLTLKEELTIHFTAGTTKERKQRTREVCRKLHLSLVLNEWFTSHYTRQGKMLVLKPEHTHTPLYAHTAPIFTKHLKMASEAAKVNWRKNSLRHTYVTAAIKGRFDGDIERTKDSIGHSMSSNVIRNNYLGHYSKADSEAYFDYSAEEGLVFDRYGG